MTSTLLFIALSFAYGAVIAPMVNLRSPLSWALMAVPSLAYLIGCAA